MQWSAVEEKIIENLLGRRPALEVCVPALRAMHEILVRTYDRGGVLFTCGNGGSHTDAVHIVGELMKSFERKRPLPVFVQQRLEKEPCGDELVHGLEAGLRAYALGLNGALKTAVENDISVSGIAFAQELYVMAKPFDALLALSTSGNARNCLLAMSVAHALDLPTLVFTGPNGGEMAKRATVCIHAPGNSTKEIQEAHIALWHTLCLLIEAHYFPEPRR
jgi:D-sedoheptulose 7-phosphate isomerase